MDGQPLQHLTHDEIDAWLAGALPPEAERHLERCPACVELLQVESELIERLAALPSLAPSPGFADRVMAAVRIPDPFALRATRLAVRRLFATRKAAVVAVTLALVVFGAMGTSVVWTLANRELLAAAGSWIAAQAGQWAWVAVRSVAASVLEQPWYDGLRGLIGHPGLLALASAGISAAYVSGVLAMRRLLAVPARRVAHANG